MNLPHPTCARFTTSGSVRRLHDSTLTSERSWTLRFAWSSISPFVASSSSVPSGRSSPRPTHSTCGGTSGMWQIQLFYISCFAAAKAPLREAHAWRSLAVPHQPSNPHLLKSRNAANHPQGGCIRHDRQGDAQRLATQANSPSREHRTTPRTRTARATPATRRHRERTTPAAPSTHSARQAKRRPQNAAGTAHETTA